MALSRYRVSFLVLPLILISIAIITLISSGWLVPKPLLQLIEFGQSRLRPSPSPLDDHHHVELDVSSSRLQSLAVKAATKSLKDLCASTQWNDGLWLQCHSYCGGNQTSICGGLNNARNRVQTCLRMAIDAGSGLILPTIMTSRNTTTLSLQQNNDELPCLDTFWNIDNLENNIGAQCPQLQLRFCGNTTGISTIIPTPHRLYKDESYHNGTFDKMVQKTLTESNITQVNIDNPVALSFGDTYTGWNYALSKELDTIRKALFLNLNFNQRLLGISNHILQSPQLREGYIGVHLRGENDWPADFGSLEVQMDMYAADMENFQHTSDLQLKVVYVSCGDQQAIQRFRERLEPLGYSVFDKWIILKDQEDILHQVTSLQFDEMGIVEYQALVSANLFIGILMSSMSSLVAYARSVDESDDFFQDHVFPQSSRHGLERSYEGGVQMKGNRFTRVLVVDGVDIMDSFP